MIRFRTRADEALYMTIRTEMWMNLVSGLKHDPRTLQEVLRAFGKLEAFVHYEGVAQGAHAAVLTRSDGTDPFGAHREAYGMSDTPLSDRENGRFPTEPLEFAPTTLAEAQARTQTQAQALPEPSDEPEPSFDEPYEPDDEGTDDVERFLGTGGETDGDDDGERFQSQPDLLDRVRSELMGAKFESWDEMIMSLHIKMHVDAASLDMQLLSPEGQTVLSQCNIEVRPGMYFNPTAIEYRAASAT